jgi:putative cardiolipin synthase
VLLISDARQAASIRLNLARGAHSSIFVSSYLMKSDRVGLTLLNELTQARSRGIRVVLLVDSIHFGLSPGMLSYLDSIGIELYRFSPIRVSEPSKWVRRMHDKLFLVDGQEAVIGDRNLASEYYGLTDRPRVSRDLLFAGDSARDAQNYFDELLKSEHVERLHPPAAAPNQLATARAQLRGVSKKAVQDRLAADESWKSAMVEVESAAFHHDPIDGKDAAQGIYSEIVRAIDGAKSEIVLESPYIVLPPELREALRKAALERKVEIRVFTNSVESSSQALAAAARIQGLFDPKRSNRASKNSWGARARSPREFPETSRGTASITPNPW